MRPYDERQTRGLYRSRKGVIFGVCRGIADHFSFSVFWTRVIAVGLIFFSYGWAVVGYVVAAMVMKPQPVVPFREQHDREFYDSYMSSRTMALHRLKKTFDDVDRRIRRMEDIVTARDYDWDRRLNE